MATRLAPTVSPDTEFFWNGLREHKLLIQRCMGCQVLRQPPRAMCPVCNSLLWDTVESSGRGIVYSYVMPQHPSMPFMEYPYIVALIELDEGVRLVSNLVDVPNDDPYAEYDDLRVEVDYREHDGVLLPVFRPVGGA